MDENPQKPVENQTVEILLEIIKDQEEHIKRLKARTKRQEDYIRGLEDFTESLIRDICRMEDIRERIRNKDYEFWQMKVSRNPKKG